MPYKKSPASFMKHKSKAVGYMMKGSAFHLDTDPSPERQARLDKMKAEKEAAQAIKRKEYDAKRQLWLEKQMEKSIEQDTARNIRRQAIIEKRKQKDPSYKLKQKQIVTGQQHLQAGTTPLEMHGPGGTHPDPKKKSSYIKMYDKKGKQTGLMMEGSVAHMESMSPNKMDHGSMANYGSPAMQTDPNKDKKDKKELTGAQKLKMAGAVLGKDVSFLVKTFDDPRSSRSIVEIKKELKNKNPEKYKEIYGG